MAQIRLVPSRGDDMRGVPKRSKTISCRPVRRPAGSLVQDRAPFDDLETCDAHPVGELPQVTRFFVIDLLDRREVLANLLVQHAVQSRPHEQEDSRRKDTNDERQHARVPQGEARPYAGGQKPHPGALRRTNPTPRTV